MNKKALNKSYIFLHIEGMDLAGKSTIARIFSETTDIDWKINDKRLTDHNPIYDFAWHAMKEGQYSSDVLGYLFLSSLISDIENFNFSNNIIQDSTVLLRSINYYKVIKNNKELEEAFSKLIDKHPKPSISFYLTADIDVRKKRLNKRIEESPGKLTSMDLLIQSDPEKFIKIDESLKNLSRKYFHSHVIDTSAMSELEVVEYIKNYSKELINI